MSQNVIQIREKIISFIRQNGPSLPVHIAKEAGLSILFASAFLSELYGEKEIKMSNLRIGSSPLYFVSGQESQLEKFSPYLKSKEKEAFLILKERKILKDSEQHPAIRVALREIKDFAIPFEKDGEGFWKYFLTEEPLEKIEVIEVVEVTEPVTEELEIKEEVEEIKEEKKEIPIKEKTPKKQKSPAKSKNQNKKKDENFFNKIKDFLAKEKIEIIDIKDFQNNEAILKVKKKGNEELIFAFNQKKITEKEILKAHKKALQEHMKYSVLSLGEPSKKLNDLILAIKDLSLIDKII